ncbi:MAG: hypothetical protein KA118_18345 [Verrucomicrobia bacterium]|nr:hypothetical protein [Verrucomicrobiota bacterium]
MRTNISLVCRRWGWLRAAAVRAGWHWLLLAGCSVAWMAGAEPAWMPFAVEWRDQPASAVDLSDLIDAPAGKGGFLRIRDGHLARPDGGRVRLWGVNLTMAAGLPSSPEAASIMAGRLAKLGVNCVRFHFLDRPAPAGLIASDREDTRALDPAQLDRLDRLVAELKQRGIYSDLNLNVGRTYKAGDGVRDHELLGFAKAATYFNPRLIELQREYARQLLTHRNPYTGAEYRHERAVALVEFVNENSLVEAWFNGRLLGRNTTRNPGTWTDLPASYERELTAQYNQWIGREFPVEAVGRWRREAGVAAGAPLPRLRPDEFGKASRDRFHAEASFYLEVERRFFLGMRDYLRGELGVEPLLAGNSDHGHSRTGYPQLAGTALLDVVDSHVYWQHPRYLTDARTGRRTGFDIPNTPMVNSPLQSTVVQLSRSAVAGKPFTVSEVNHPFPHEYAFEGIPILAAYAAMQDWDGIFWYTLGHRDVVSAEPRIGGHFDLASDPVKMCQLAAGALMFLRGDVQAARRSIERSYTPDQVRESIRLPASERPYFTPGFPLGLPLRHAVRIRSFEGPETGGFEPAPEFPIRSDTGELTWALPAGKEGWVAIDTGRSQALVGFLRGERQQTRNLGVELETPCCAVTLSALDSQPIARSGSLLLTVCGPVANTGLAWNSERTSLTDWGQSPTTIEAVRGGVTLRDLEGASRVMRQALDGGGAPLGKAIEAARSGGGWRFPVGEPATTWYRLVVER